MAVFGRMILDLCQNYATRPKPYKKLIHHRYIPLDFNSITNSLLPLKKK